MLRTQVCNKWHNEKLKDCDQDWVEKQIKEFDIGAKKALTEWTNYKNNNKYEYPYYCHYIASHKIPIKTDLQPLHS